MKYAGFVETGDPVLAAKTDRRPTPRQE